MKAEERIRMLHVASLIKYLEEEKREGLHVTDLVYGCAKYAKWISQARENQTERSLDEAGILKLAVGKLLHTIPLGRWHHVDIEYRNVRGQIDDIVVHGDSLYVVDKKTIYDRPPANAHDHYVTQVRLYMYMLKRGRIIGCEKGEVGELVELVKRTAEKNIYGAILYVDVSSSTKTMLSEVKLIESLNKQEDLASWFEWIIDEVDKENPSKRVSWFCQYCPIMNPCWGEEYEL